MEQDQAEKVQKVLIEVYLLLEEEIVTEQAMVLEMVVVMAVRKPEGIETLVEVGEIDKNIEWWIFF
jgi:hypothetical protein